MLIESNIFVSAIPLCFESFFDEEFHAFLEFWIVHEFLWWTLRLSLQGIFKQKVSQLFSKKFLNGNTESYQFFAFIV